MTACGHESSSLLSSPVTPSPFFTAANRVVCPSLRFMFLIGSQAPVDCQIAVIIHPAGKTCEGEPFDDGNRLNHLPRETYLQHRRCSSDWSPECIKQSSE